MRNVTQTLLHDSAVQAPSILTIDLAAIRQNYKLIKSKVKSAQVAGVVKADGYGLGAVRVTKALYQEGCRVFFVAHLAEGVTLRQQFPDITIYVLNGLLTGNADDFLSYNIFPVLNNLHDIVTWQAVANARNEKLPCIIHFDTGMNRLGLGKAETKTFLENKEQYLKGINVNYVMSHFSCADEFESSETDRQAAEFETLVTELPNIKASLANSAGVFVGDNVHYDLVRPGMALYGLNPQPHKQNRMVQAVRLQTRILNIQEISTGESVGYGASYKAHKREKVATVSLGYADGFFRSLGEKGKLYWGDQACPFRGRISMDLATVSLDNVKGEVPKVGDMLDVIGAHQTPDDLAKNVIGGTIDYEILTSLGARYYKVYIE